MPYRTDKDLRELFDQFPRADDGSEATLPNIIPETIQPVVDLGDVTQSVGYANMVIEHIQVFALSPAAQTPAITTPLDERWIVWRAVIEHSDVVNRAVTIGLQQLGLGAAYAVMDTGLASAAFHRHVLNRSYVMHPNAAIIGTADAALTAGALILDIIFTRFALTDVLPAQTTLGF